MVFFDKLKDNCGTKSTIQRDIHDTQRGKDMSDKTPQTHKTAGDIQLDQFLRDLESKEGRDRIAKDAYKEAMEAERRKSVIPPGRR